MQWGTVTGTQSSAEQQIGSFNFPRSFTTYYTMVTTLVNTDTNNPQNFDGGFQVRNVTKSSFTLYQQKYSSAAWFNKCNYIAIGVS